MSTTRCTECQTELPADGYVGLCPRCVAGTMDGLWEVLQSGPGSADATHSERPTVPGWQVLEPLGAGGQGIVWHAVRLEDDVQGAVKVFRPDRLGGDENVLRRDAEVNALRALDHPNIVRVLDAGQTTDGAFYVITEFVEGCDLQHLMQAGALGVERALSIMKQIAQALMHAHERGVVHRDLKPANVLVARGDVVKLADFSLAQRRGSKALLSMTRAGTTFGTPYYLAPEVMRGQGATAASDLYALGVMLYELLTGAPPAGKFSSASEKCDLPREVDGLIESLLAEDPARRPASAHAVLTALDHITALRAGALAARLRRHRWTLVATSIGCAVLAGVIGYLIPRPVPPPPPLPRVNAKGFANPAVATREAPWRNSLEMRFIPVRGLERLLVCQHETRMSDYLYSLAMGEGVEGAAWAEAYGNPDVTRSALQDLRPSGWTMQPGSRSSVPAGLLALGLREDAAASGISFHMARRFCAWLSWREQREGRLAPNHYYRLPTDEEWSVASGMPAETEPTPEKRNKALQGTVHPWGNAWPPPANFANYAGTEARDANWPAAWLSLPEQNDAWSRSAPVMQFPPTSTGLYDVWGNVWEWCDSAPNVHSVEMTLRGGAWVEGGYKALMRMDFRRFERPTVRESCMGFRCVLVVPELPSEKK
ncbi:MAG: protein kinase [Verrucomicrobiaceae bacterium]|nr:protein kinase [Verrucomicrobiaceae bacterium]